MSGGKTNQECIVNDIRRLFLNTRSFPKCFQSNVNAIFIYNFIQDHYPLLINKPEVKNLFSLYTLLFCGIQSLNNPKPGEVQKIQVRFSRFLNMDASTNWSFMTKIFKQMLNKKLDYFEKNMSTNDYDIFRKKHQSIEKHIMTELKKVGVAESPSPATQT